LIARINVVLVDFLAVKRCTGARIEIAEVAFSADGENHGMARGYGFIVDRDFASLAPANEQRPAFQCDGGLAVDFHAEGRQL
jgi:hypothetical protein